MKLSGHSAALSQAKCTSGHEGGHSHPDSGKAEECPREMLNPESPNTHRISDSLIRAVTPQEQLSQRAPYTGRVFRHATGSGQGS
jgi:hypothetical protein